MWQIGPTRLQNLIRACTVCHSSSRVISQQQIVEWSYSNGKVLRCSKCQYCRFCLCWGFTSQSTQWGHVVQYQFTLPDFYWTGFVLQAVNQYCAHSFTRNWQLPFLNQRKGDNDWRKYFMITSLICIQLSHRSLKLVSERFHHFPTIQVPCFVFFVTPNTWIHQCFSIPILKFAKVHQTTCWLV